ncbi:MAG: efflux RND transporter permease subunit [Gammaproteobacteria bacterium]|nr:efflux RND transporter permease subunit [Gammaproteobacteria bacterium]
MLAGIVESSIRFRGVVALLALALTAYGVLRASRAGLDIFPEFSPKAVIVQTEAAGMAPEQIEQLVTRPIEAALTGLIGLDHLRSESIEGLSVVTAEFRDDTDILRNRQLVAERLADVRRELPGNAGIPMAVPLASSSATVRTIGLSSGRADLMTLRDLVDTSLVPALLAVPGVADVNVFGGGVRTLRIAIDPQALRRADLSVAELVDAVLGAANPGAALGFVENSNQRLSIALSGTPQTADALAAIVLKQGPAGRLRLGDLATVRMAAEPAIGGAQIMGKAGIVMMVIGQYGANTLTVSNALKDVLDGFERRLSRERITLYPALFVPANYIEASLHNIAEHLTIGGGFVLLVLALFLFDVRAAFVSAVAIPLSLLGALLVLLEAGMNVNIMVLGGLAIALGEVVDDAIIDTENIYRRLRENRQSAAPRPAAEVVLRASLEVRGSVVYASFIVALVFVPLLTIPGVAGRLFAPLGMTYILAIAASLGVALTVTPALCCLLLAHAGLRADDPPLTRWVKPGYRIVLGLVARRPWPTLVATLAVCAATLALLPRQAEQFLPPLREGHYIVHTTGLPGTSLTETLRLGSRLTEEIARLPGVTTVSQWAGRAARGADTYGTHYSEYEVNLEPMSGREQQRVADDICALAAGFPGMTLEVNTFLTERVDETISGYTAPVVVNVYGQDLVALDEKARQIAAIMRSVPGAAGVQVRSSADVPLAQVELDPERLAIHGVKPQEVTATLATAYDGAEAGKVFVNNRLARVVVMLDDAARQDAGAMLDLPVRTGDGRLVPLAAVADVEQIGGRYNVLHRAGQRLQAVTGTVTGGDLRRFVKELARRIEAEVDVPGDMRLEYTGASVEQARAREDLIVHAALAGIGVLALVSLAVGSARHVLLILVNLPFSLAGGVLAVVATGATLSIGSVVGFVTLFGITVRNSIMLVSHYRHLVVEAGLPWNLETALRGAEERLPSIAMTALVTALAMLPIATNSDNAGREIMGPMATIIIGGLVSSAILNLLVMPSIMLRFGRFGAPRAD